MGKLDPSKENSVVGRDPTMGGERAVRAVDDGHTLVARVGVTRLCPVDQPNPGSGTRRKELEASEALRGDPFGGVVYGGLPRERHNLTRQPWP